MALTGRFVLLVALGVVPIVLFGDSAATALALLGGWLVLALVLGGIDLGLAA